MSGFSDRSLSMSLSKKIRHWVACTNKVGPVRFSPETLSTNLLGGSRFLKLSHQHILSPLPLGVNLPPQNGVRTLFRLRQILLHHYGYLDEVEAPMGTTRQADEDSIDGSDG